MRCIFCLQKKPPSWEHVFPRSLGSTIQFDRVCKDCNSYLGARVDSALVGFLPVKTRRVELELAGHSRSVPHRFGILEGVHDAFGPNGEKFRVHSKFNKATGQFDQERLTNSEVIENPDGTKTFHFAVDVRNVKQIPELIRRQRAKLGLRPLTNEEMQIEVAKGVAQEIKNPIIKADFRVSFAFLRQAMLKIAYELAFLWLGEDYLNDPQAVILRKAIIKDDVSSTDNIQCYIGDANSCSPLTAAYIPHPNHHISYMEEIQNNLFVVVRVFDIYAACVPVTFSANCYLKEKADYEKLRFLVIDAVDQKYFETSIAEERRRMALEMTRLGRIPPFSDPMSDRLLL